MAREVLSNGVIVPEKYTRDWFDDFRTNLVKLNDAITAMAGKQNALTQEQLDAVNSAITSQKVTAYDDHIADTSKHLTDDTAPKAIADEDGTRIKTGYGKLAGNQTWSGTQLWQSALYVYNSDSTASTPNLNLRNSKVTKGTTTDSGSQIIQYLDKDNKFLSQITTAKATTGTTQLSFVLGNLDSNSNSLKSSLVYSLATDGTKQFTPGTNSTHSLGSSSYQWSSVYAQSYFYNGTEFLNKFVTTDTSQNISSQKTFNANLVCTSSIYTRNGNYTSGTVPTSSMIAMNRFVDKNNLDIGYTRAVIRADGSTEAELRSLNRFTNGALNPDGSAISSSLVVGISSTGSTYVQFNGRLQNGLIPTTSGSYDCGTSTNKWKTLNGVNPGALSLPDFTSETGVSLSAGANTYTPVLSGWLSISTTGDISVVCGNFCHKATDMISVPVIAGKTYTVTMPASATGYFYSCLGNV